MLLFEGYCLMDHFLCRNTGVSHFKLSVPYLRQGQCLFGNSVIHRERLVSDTLLYQRQRFTGFKPAMFELLTSLLRPTVLNDIALSLNLGFPGGSSFNSRKWKGIASVSHFPHDEWWVWIVRCIRPSRTTHALRRGRLAGV